MRFVFVLMLIGCVQLSAQINYNKIVDSYCNEKSFSGVVLVASKGKIDCVKACGLANREFLVPFTTQTKFKIASITKTFTAVLILQLNQEGLLNLNNTIGKYLPEYKGEAKNKVTIHHLLTYSSGIPNFEGDSGIAVYQKAINVGDFINKYCSGALQSEPGKKFNYNNADYIILGGIIEKVTGKSFLQNLQDRIFKPLKMNNTSMLQSKDIVGGLADTYNTDTLNVFYKDDPFYIENYYSAGALYSTAEDLLKFDSGLFNYQLLTKKTVELMLTPYADLYGVAYGFWVYDENIGGKTIKMANRQGSIWGANAYWLHLINEDKTFIVLSNTNATNLHNLAMELVSLSVNNK